MSYKKIFLKHKERCILSEVLPYEVPLIFNNRNFYRFLVDNRVEFRNNEIRWLKKSDSLDALIRIILGIDIKYPVDLKEDVINGIKYNINSIVFSDKRKLMSIPFTYRIRHKDTEFRELSICHPRNQIMIVDFYDKYKEIIIYFCKKSNFSIRYPAKISKYIYFNDKLHRDSLQEQESHVEENDKEYNILKSFFVYEKYSNIYKFYESYSYHRCEQKYHEMMKLDVSKCFDSIYTHSIAWAIYSKDYVKKNIPGTQQTFPGQFDELLQLLNYRETNGIIIGPELSRIFAELILQDVDFQLEQSLNEKYKLYHRTHYEIFRYVDDYFIFYNEEQTKNSILSELQVVLKKFRLYLNSNKQLIFSKPIITDISIAKHKISSLLNERLSITIFDLSTIDSVESVKQKKGASWLTSKNLIIEYKTIIKECHVSYSDVLGYTLEILDNKSKKILKRLQKVQKEYKLDNHLLKVVIAILEFSFFIYSVSPRVNTTIKLCRMLGRIIQFYKNRDINIDFKHIVFKKIYDNIVFQLKRNQISEYTQVETLYLLITLSELGKYYWLDEDSLASYFNIRKNKDTGGFVEGYQLNYFSLMVILFYIKNKKKYDVLSTFVKEIILRKITKEKITQDTETILLLLDSLLCPYIDVSSKIKFLRNIGVQTNALAKDIIEEQIIKKAKRGYSSYWFIKWAGFDFTKELDAKKSREVY